MGVVGAWVTGAGDWKWSVGVASVPVWVFCLGVLSGRCLGVVWALCVSAPCPGMVACLWCKSEES